MTLRVMNPQEVNLKNHNILMLTNTKIYDLINTFELKTW